MKKLIILICAYSFHLAGAETLTLDKCMQLALKNNHELKNARINIEKADEDKKIAFTNYFPIVQANSSVFQATNNLIESEINMGPSALPISLVKKGIVSSVSAVQPIFMGGKIINGNKLASLQTDVEKLKYNISEKDIKSQVALYYWTIVSLNGNLSTLDTIDKQLQEVHRITKNFVEAGVANHNNLLRVELKQQEIASQRLKVENGLDLAKLALGQLIGISSDELQIATENNSEFLAPKAPGTYYIEPNQALQSRDELALSSKNIDAKKQLLKMERGKALPSLGVGGALLNYNIVDKNNNNALVFATLSVPISNWWSTHHGIKKARLSKLQAENSRRETQEKLNLDIQKTWKNLMEAYSQIAIAKKSVISSEENLRISTTQYKAGTESITDLLDAETLYSQSQSQFISACANYQIELHKYLLKTR